MVVQLLGFDVRDVFKDKTRRFGCWVSEHIVQFNDVWTSKECLQDFSLSVYFFSADRLQNFDNARLVVVRIDALENLRIFASTELLLYLVVVHFVPRDIVFVVVRVVFRPFCTNVFIRPCEG